MDMSKVDKDIAEARACGKVPVLLLGINTMHELIASQKVNRHAGLIAKYNDVDVILNACNPDKCEVVVRE